MQTRAQLDATAVVMARDGSDSWHTAGSRDVLQAKTTGPADGLHVRGVGEKDTRKTPRFLAEATKWTGRPLTKI